MTLATKLELLATRGAFARLGTVTKRWGQLLRESPSLASVLRSLEASEQLVPLHTLGRIHSGVVTRANAYFIVRDLPFEQIPRRFAITKNDAKRIAVVMDGLETPHRIERQFLRRLIKGPEVLVSPADIERTDLLLFDVDVDRTKLREMRATGALAYLRRGETVAYNVSEDTLKGGIPAQRSQVRNRKPHWYSLNVPAVSGTRIALPEHFDKRYIATLIGPTDQSVVIDTLYTFEPYDQNNAQLIWASLNSLLTWYQLELRGRTQHGQGVLKVKIPDYGGILVINPQRVPPSSTERLLSAFQKLAKIPLTNSLEAVSMPTRMEFDELYLKAGRWRDLEAFRLTLERELRAAISERHERKASVLEAKLDRKRTTNIAASIDAYAARLAASLESFPDPRRFLSRSFLSNKVLISGPLEGKLSVGAELFNQGDVFAGDVCVAKAGNVLSGQFVRAVLLHDPALKRVDVPKEPELGQVLAFWKHAVSEWQAKFDKALAALTRTVVDVRTKDAIRRRALVLLHAE